MCQSEAPLAVYALNNDEWKYLEKLHMLLHEFNVLTMFISSSLSYPTINRAMSIYNAMLDHLEEFYNKENDPLLKQAATQGINKLI